MIGGLSTVYAIKALNALLANGQQRLRDKGHKPNKPSYLFSYKYPWSMTHSNPINLSSRTLQYLLFRSTVTEKSVNVPIFSFPGNS